MSRKPKVLFHAGMGLFIALAGVTAVMWVTAGGLDTSYVLVMIPTSAVAVICIFSGFLALLRGDMSEIKQLAGISADHSHRIMALEAMLGDIRVFLAERHGYATGYVEGVVNRESGEYAAVHWLPGARNGGKTKT